ncbi:MAG: His/Gly/Thr/Pro-type tRNA ligase C-terminal domain-containing protein [Flavobacteriales bacterium]
MAIVGEAELASGTVTLKDMREGSQHEVTLAEAVSTVSRA